MEFNREEIRELMFTEMKGYEWKITETNGCEWNVTSLREVNGM